MKKTNENNEAASCEIKREGDEDYTKIEKAGNGFPYVITQNGTYTIRLTDKFGKSATTTLEYKNIKKDMTAPEISGVEDGKCTEYGMQISIGKPSITAKSTNGTTIIRWKKVSNASGYKVYRAKKKKGKYELLNTTEALSYSDSSIIGGRNYYYKVVAYYKNESTTINGEASDVVLQVGTLKKVSLRVKNKKKSTASLSWKKVAGAKKYQIYRATRKKGKYSKIATTKKLTYKNTSLSKKKTYYYKVRAYYVKAGKNIYGSYSNVKSIKIIK